MIVDLLKASAPAVQAGPRSARVFASNLPGRVGSHSGFGPGVEIVNALVSGGVGHVFLKQFRDRPFPTIPCYQAVCKTDTVPGKFRGGARVEPGAYRIIIGNFASEPLLSYLGKTPAAGARRDHAGLRVLDGPRRRADDRPGDRELLRKWVSPRPDEPRPRELEHRRASPSHRRAGALIFSRHRANIQQAVTGGVPCLTSGTGSESRSSGAGVRRWRPPGISRRASRLIGAT